MKPVKELTGADSIRFVCTDIDDTLTKDGKLPARTYQALWDLHDAGIGVIPVTGRPAGWCDLIARQWPVEAVVGENGAFAYYLEDGRLRQMYHPSVAPDEIVARLAEIRERVLREVPGARVAKDQFSRKFDLAIDFREEPPDLGFDVAETIASICREMGATAKISSIHVNAWFGNYSKVDMIEVYLAERRSIDRETQKKTVVYCGDSPNDAPMFRRFPLSCGVANIKPLLGLVEHKPTYVTDRSHGDGFVELVTILLSELTTRGELE
jgi:HAD superfamily hydrolase (TIGR01484 family)